MNSMAELVARNTHHRLHAVTLVCEESKTLSLFLREAFTKIHVQSLRGPAQFVGVNGQTLEAVEDELKLLKDSTTIHAVVSVPHFEDAKVVGVLPRLNIPVFASPKVPRGLFLLGRVHDTLCLPYVLMPVLTPTGLDIETVSVPVSQGQVSWYARVEVPSLQVG